MKETNTLYTDPAGKNTLDAISVADRFNAWMFAVIQPFCSGRILEIGSGIGNISSVFLTNNATICLSDLRPEYCQDLNHKFSHFKNLLGIEVMDLIDPSFDRKYAHLFDSFDTVFALNVIEHIENDRQAIANASKLLKQNGRLIILVPAYQSLFCLFDIEFGHYRRYTRTSLLKLLHRPEFTIDNSFYFNAGGILGWLLFGILLKRKRIETKNMVLFNKLIPVFKLIDWLTFRKIGLSVIAVCTKNRTL
jgi:SAM-dependent methyltransferase